MFFGFEMVKGEWRDIVPAVFQSLSKQELHEVFINQYNFCVDKDERIGIKKETCSANLFEVFQNKISSDLKTKNRFYKCKIFDPYSAVLAALFERKEFDKIRTFVRQSSVLPGASWARLIFRIFSNENAGLVFNAKKLFAEFVLEKISLKNPDKNVYFEDGLIVIDKNNKRLLSIMPCLKEFDKDKIHLASCEIDEAWRVVAQGKTNSLYIVFPRNDTFRRHIEVRNPYFTNSLVKLIPYTINFRRDKCR